MKTIRVHVDCEFTDFINCELISIALVCAGGEEFYGELGDFDESACSPFVREAVLPQLGQFPASIFTHAELRGALLAWLDEFAAGVQCIVCVDNITDWDLLIDLLGDVPPNWQGVLVGRIIDREAQEAYFQQHSGRHHALYDARALSVAIPEDLTEALSVVDVKHSRYF